MSATKTKPAEAFLPEQATAALESARQARSQVLDRIAAGGTVEAVELAEADDAVRLAELRIEVGERNAAEVAERERMARLRHLVDALTGPGQRERAAAVLDAYRKAEEALRILLQAGEARRVGVSDDLREVGRLALAGDVPADIDVDLDAFGCQAVTANGVRVQASDFVDAPHVLLADAAAAVIDADTRRSPVGNELVGLAGSYRTVRLERLEHLTETEGS